MKLSALKFAPLAFFVVLSMIGAQIEPANAEVVDVSPTGFALKIVVHVAAPPERVYAALVQPSRWWDSEHTFSGSAANLTLDAKAGGCFCETLPNGGSVMHQTIAFVVPGKVLRMRGALGPFQAFGVDGSLTWSLAPAGSETELTVTNDIGGHMTGGFGEWPRRADAMISGQVARLKKFVETGAP